MKMNQIVLLLTVVLGACHAGAEVGNRYEHSVRKYGQPIGKLMMHDQIVYLFQKNDSTAREVYNLEGKCISSDFGETVPPAPEIVTSKPTTELKAAPKTAVKTAAKAAPKTAAKPTQEPAPVKPIVAARWISLSVLMMICAVTVIILIKRKGSRSSAAGAQPSLLDVPNQAKTSDSKIIRTPAFQQKASAKLSENEICFYKALQEVVKEHYIITFHVGLDRIIDIQNDEFDAYSSMYKDIEPVFVDFVLHDSVDASVAAVILLHDTKVRYATKSNRLNFLHGVLKEHNIPVIEFNESEQYTPSKIKKIVFKESKQRAA